MTDDYFAYHYHDYALALKTAGALIHAYKEFGSYSGDWWARVTYDTRTGWVHGEYGCCIYCDPFEHEFYSGSGNRTADGHPAPGPLTAFGRRYLEDGLLTQEEAEKKAAEYASDSLEDEEMLAWVRSFRPSEEAEKKERTS